ncbi:hypothetical protein B0T20DRAFT_348574 [Sordaria brevicollis]|uniref:DUF4604 domain-containing protein n=1 Tax=Sordaria brevicollis TaxID=83679 RepID=A0AAE0UE47_SORBR|nr:hypothetical protein B0T20DRAFT_348574 [Sordaria brevicollis]
MSGSGGGGGKINPKNLLYDRSATLPPFLARLHAQHSPGNFDGPDPILAARRRPTKKRSGSEEAEDAPVILDEGGNVIDTVTLGKDGTVMEKEAQGGDEGETTTTKEKEEAGKQEKNVGIGASKKRKVGKVIGGGDDSDQEQEGGASSSGKKRRADDSAVQEKDSGKTEEGEEKPKPKATKKKAKKIKLSFGDEEG